MPELDPGKGNDLSGTEDLWPDFLKTWPLVKRYRSSLFLLPSPVQDSSESVLDGPPSIGLFESSAEGVGSLFALWLNCRT